MATMDIFNADAFSMVQLTTAIEKVPHVPQFLGALNIFEPDPIPTLDVAVEKVGNTLTIVQTSARGAPPAKRTNEKRDIRSFRTVRLAEDDTIYAHEIQNIRAFGSMTELQGVQAEVAKRNMKLRRNLELTHEHMRLGAVQGIVLDADKTVIRNWYTEWGIAQPSAFAFALGTATTLVRGKCQAVIRAMQRAANGAWTPQTQVHALCGDTFFDKLIDHPLVRDTYQNWAAAADLRQDLSFRSFPYGGIVFHNYRGTDDFDTAAATGTAGFGINASEAKFFPVNAPEVFKVAWSPGESFEYVNTPGQEIYNMIVPDRDRNTFVSVEMYSYPLYICTRPEMLQSATTN